jgi:hypothetical protein
MTVCWRNHTHFVIPAKAGIHVLNYGFETADVVLGSHCERWIPAFAGMTRVGVGDYERI